MKTSTKRATHLPSRELLAICVLAVASSFASAAFAEPVTYRATVVTDIRLGTTSYHNAALKLTFSGNTSDIGVATDANGNPLNARCFFWITKGAAAFSFESAGRKIFGHFLTGQIFVALDACAAGIGFGSFTGPLGFEPVYPLGLTHGSADTFAFGAGSSPLSTAANTSGNAWSCIGFPPANGGQCAAPDSYPLHTDAGDLFVYMPYLFTCGGGGTSICLTKSGTMNRGTFSVIPGAAESD